MRGSTPGRGHHVPSVGRQGAQQTATSPPWTGLFLAHLLQTWVKALDHFRDKPTTQTEGGQVWKDLFSILLSDLQNCSRQPGQTGSTEALYLVIFKEEWTLNFTVFPFSLPWGSPAQEPSGQKWEQSQQLSKQRNKHTADASSTGQAG